MGFTWVTHVSDWTSNANSNGLFSMEPHNFYLFFHCTKNFEHILYNTAWKTWHTKHMCFCNTYFYERFSQNLNFVDTIFCTDEATFSTAKMLFSIRNTHIWADENLVRKSIMNGRYGLFHWPANSPDLTTLDTFLWIMGYLTRETKIFKKLKEKIRYSNINLFTQ